MKKEYDHYTADDFIAEESFQQWVRNPVPEISRFWEQWIRAHPSKINEVTQAVNFLNGIQFKTDFPAEEDTEFAYKKQLQLIEAIADVKPQTQKKKVISGVLGWVSGILFTGLILFSGWYFWRPDVLSIQTLTVNDETKIVTLPDSSVVTLNGNSKLKYLSNLTEASTRQVWLDGEAFFEVKEDDRPFVVHSGEIDAEVLGTSFNLHKRGSVINVSLNSGKIKIDLKDDAGSTIYLEPGDFIQYSPKDNHIFKKKVIPDLYSGWTNEKFESDKIPFSTIADYISDVYGCDIRIENSDLAEMKVSGILLLDSQESVLETLSFLANVEIVKKGRVVTFQNKKF